VSLAAAFAHVFFSDGGRRVFVDRAESTPSVRGEVLDAGLDRYYARV
jgi:hypothetical protein